MIAQSLMAERSADEPAATRADPQNLKLSIVMPCLNEAETIAVCVKKARYCLERTGILDRRFEQNQLRLGSRDVHRERRLGNNARQRKGRFGSCESLCRNAWQPESR
jgi:hypothetical protein